MKTGLIILFLILLITNVLAADINEIFIPYNRNILILEGPKTTYLNSFKNQTFQYIVYNERIKDIKNYYKNKFSRIGYIEKMDKKTTRNRKKYNYLQFTKDNNEVSIWLSKENQNDVEILLILSENNRKTKNNQFKINNKKDNPGFDLKDVPRPDGSIRIASLYNSDDNHNDVCNIIYKSKLPRKYLAEFYMKNMKKTGWAPSYYKNFFYNDMGFWMTFNKQDKTCLVSIMHMQELKSNAVSIYYGYKK